jgi:hypothetical protein
LENPHDAAHLFVFWHNAIVSLSAIAPHAEKLAGLGMFSRLVRNAVDLIR